MKQLPLIAVICSFAALSAQAGVPEIHAGQAALPPGLETGPVLAKGGTQGCSATVSGGGNGACAPKGGALDFPVMIGVYR